MTSFTREAKVRFEREPIEKHYEGKYSELFQQVNDLQSTPEEALVVSGFMSKTEALRWQIALSQIRSNAVPVTSTGIIYPVVKDYDINSTLRKNGRGWALKVWLEEPTTPDGNDREIEKTGHYVDEEGFVRTG